MFFIERTCKLVGLLIVLCFMDTESSFGTNFRGITRICNGTRYNRALAGEWAECDLTLQEI